MRTGRGIGQLAAALLAAALALPATAQPYVRDIARPHGLRENKLVGLGLVMGLRGTGDGAKNVQALRTLAQLFEQLGSNVTDLRSINADNVALVQITVTVPATGAREGDALDVHVAAINGAKSLRGGRLMLSPLLGPMPGSETVYGLAEGALTIEDEAVPTVAVAKGGAILEQEVPVYCVQEGRMTLVLDASHASWGMASTIAKIINEDSGQRQPVARAVDPASILVMIPPAERLDPADYISRVMSLPVLLPDREARIVINERTGTIIVTGDVVVEPTLIAHEGLVINRVTPPLVPTPEAPQLEVQPYLAMDPQRTGGAKLNDLLAAFNQLKVPVQEQIEILRTLHRSGYLHARLIEE